MASIKSTLLAALSLASETVAVRLLASHFSGPIYTLEFSPANATLAITSQAAGCGVTPTWLTLDEKTRTLYCFDESWQGSGVITQYSIDGKGPSALAVTGSAKTPGNSVHGSLYGGPDGRSFVITSE